MTQRTDVSRPTLVDTIDVTFDVKTGEIRKCAIFSNSRLETVIPIQQSSSAIVVTEAPTRDHKQVVQTIYSQNGFCGLELFAQESTKVVTRATFHAVDQRMPCQLSSRIVPITLELRKSLKQGQSQGQEKLVLVKRDVRTSEFAAVHVESVDGKRASSATRPAVVDIRMEFAERNQQQTDDAPRSIGSFLSTVVLGMLAFLALRLVVEKQKGDDADDGSDKAGSPKATLDELSRV